MLGVVNVYAGSACENQPGKGGWATLLVFNGHKKEIFGSATFTTNNRMELVAVINCLKSLKTSCVVQVITNSQYVQKGGKDWLKQWKIEGRLESVDIENSDLWREIDNLCHVHIIHWVRESKSNDADVSRVCELARFSMKQ